MKSRLTRRARIGQEAGETVPRRSHYLISSSLATVLSRCQRGGQVFFRLAPKCWQVRLRQLKSPAEPAPQTMWGNPATLPSAIGANPA